MEKEKSAKRYVVPIAISVAVIGALSIVAVQVKKQIDLLMKYCYKIKGFKIVSFTKDRLKCSFTVLFRNKSDIGVKIKSYYVDIILNGKNLGRVSNEKLMTLKPNGVSELFVDADLNPEKAYTLKEILALLGYLALDKSKIVFTFDGKARIKYSFLPVIGVPFKLTYTLKELLEDDTEEEVCKV
jgi:LEA14-like dessication related protein